MEINYDLTEEDYVNFNIHHIENSPNHKITFNLQKYGLAIFYIIALPLIGTNIFNQSSTYWFIASAILSIAWVLLYKRIYRGMISSGTKKLIKQANSSRILGEKTLVLDEENLSIFDGETVQRMERETIHDVKVYSDMILIYINPTSAHVIPTRDLNEDVKEMFIEEIKKSI